MTADRLTKVLPVNKWSSFLEQLGMVETKERISPRELDIEGLLDGIETLEIGNCPKEEVFPPRDR